MDAPLLDALREVAALLTARRIPFVVVGGLANAVWGDPRVTRDLDLKVFIGGLSVVEFEALIAQDLEVLPRSPDASPLIVSALIRQSVIADLLIAVPGYEDGLLGRAVSIDLGGLELPVCSAEDLIIQKVIADRDKDWADIEGVLIEQREHLDYEYITNWLTQFAEALERSDWVERFKRMRGESGGGHQTKEREELA